MSAKHTVDSWLKTLPEGYTDKYDYTSVIYAGNKTKIAIRCKKHDSVFMVTPNNHARGKSGCPICKRENIAERNKGNSHATLQTGISKRGAAYYARRFKSEHGDKYTYHWETFTVTTEKMRITCPEHGDFWQTPSIHARGAGCMHCYHESQRSGSDTIRTKLENIHPNLVFIAVPAIRHDTVQFVCPTHGAQTGFVHSMLGGHGCIECGWDRSVAVARAAQGGLVSKPILFLQKFIEAHGFETVLEFSPDWLGRRSLDLYVPEAKFAIEFNGAWCHHSSPESSSAVAKYARKRDVHFKKWEVCKNNSISLLQIWDFKWESMQHIYLHKILHRLGLDTSVYARKCRVVETTKGAVSPLYASGSLEGGMALPNNAKHYALEYNGTQVMWMTVGEKVREWGKQNEVLRMHTLPGVTVVGGVSKLLKLCPPGTVMFTTNDTGSVFGEGSQSGSRYWWYHPATKRLLTRAAANPTRRVRECGNEPEPGESERAHMERNGWVRVWDSGLTKHVV